MRTCLLNDAASDCSHHFPCSNSSGRWCLVVNTTQERHVVGIRWYDSASPSNNVWSTCVDNWLLFVSRANLVFILILAWQLLLICKAQGRCSSCILLCRLGILHKLGHANALLRSLSIYQTHVIDAGLPVVWLRLLNWRLRLSRMLLLLLLLVCIAIWLRAKPVVIGQKFIFHLLSVISTACIDSLSIVVIVLKTIFIRIIRSIPLLLLYHAAKLLIICDNGIVPLLLHLLIKLMKCRALLQRILLRGLLLLLHLLNR